MTDLQKMTAIQDAQVILNSARLQAAGESHSIWLIIRNAGKHLDANMRDLIYG
jgi:hypothetical protein